MTVECENCKTRFHVADARIPAKGARVRCSRCHHRFHITPSYVPPSRPAEQGSAAESVLGGEAAREEDELDNPEFLFDNKNEDSDATSAKPPRARRPDPREAETQLDQPKLAEPPEPKTPPPPPEPRVVVSGGATAQEMIDDGEPEIATGRFDIDAALGERNSEIGEREEQPVSSATARALLGRDMEDTGESAEPLVPSKPAPRTTSSVPSGASRPPKPGDPPAPIKPAAPSAPAAPAAPAAPKKSAFADLADIAAELGEDEDTSFADWDPLATPASAATAGAAPAASVLGPRTTKLYPDPPAAQAGAKPARRAKADSAEFDPEAASPAALILRVAAMLVGLTLLGAAARLVWLQGGSAPSAPHVVQAAGWVAADLETFLARNATGERVVVVRGNLFPEGSAPPPKVQVRLLGADGAPLVESAPTWLERVDDAEVAPDRLGLRFAAAGGEIGGIGQFVTGFTAVIPDPPPGVYRVEVALHAGELRPEGTAIADTPEAPSAEPNTQTVQPAPAAAPQATTDDDVVPAAPQPD
jgi:predicted Zn finger-like uncharacterized protein